ncbi:unnamed protein product [Brachionus calyciflorus]|uniref:Unconventional prefoldin RPB5 interactor n=1 Tax=Brachionus calyciflorus TaxID=104777 RepID=A0A814GVS1_9BILA|nr:unnamed protein product [Brachionus calyciflorus]
MSQNFEKLEHFVRLRTEQENYLKVCDQKLGNWQKFKDDYLTLKSRLETLPHELRYEVMVPISKVAFMTGRLVNTNEILVLLGDNWFVEKSAKQSCDLIDRRLKNIEKFLDDLHKEKKNLQEQINWTENLLQEKGEYVNIEEKLEDEPIKQKSQKEISEEEKREIRRKLQEKALQTSLELENEIKKDFKSLYKPKENKIEKVEENTEEEEEEDVVQIVNNGPNFMSQLEEDIKNLDLGEKFDEDDEQLRNLMSEYDKGINRENNKQIEKDLKKQVKWSNVEESQAKKVENSQYDEDDFEYSESDEEEEEEEDDEIAEEYVKVEPIKIQIKHTANEFIEEQDRRLRLSREKPEINSPADIYSVFNKPKSILKKTSLTPIESDHILPVEHKKVEPKNAEMEKFEPQKAFTGEIVEKNVISIQSHDMGSENKKPVSKFKASKFSQNK